jgi:hypothetical protein
MCAEYKIRFARGVMLASLACLFLSLPGCGGKQGAKDLPLDHSLARQSLTTALDAWKAGGKPASLKDGTPSIIVGDPTWDSGAKLTEYKLGAERDMGANLEVTVQLTLERDGLPSTREATYVVGTSPVITVFTE